MIIKTELVGGVFDGTIIQLDGKTLPMQIEYPYFPNIDELLDVINQVPSNKADKPISSYKTIIYTLQNDGNYKEETK